MQVFILFLLFFFESNALKAGIYVDNGFDQTTIDHDLPEEERMRLELEILHVLGLPTKPTKIQKSLKKSTLTYLMDMYDFLNKESHHRNKRSTISVDKQLAIEDSDMIMTFDSTSDSRVVPHEKGRRLWFNMAKMPIAEDVVDAELRVFQRWVPNKFEEIFILAVYELGQFNNKEMNLISSTTVTGGSSGWLSVNLTSWVLSWVLASGATKGLYVVVYPTENPGIEMRPEMIGLTTDDKYAEIQPFVVVFFKNINHVYHRRITRDVKSNQQSESVKYPSFMKTYKNESWKTCRIHTLYISFKDLRWHNWIIAPEGYSAFYCAGECKFPLTHHMNATGHALVQSWVHFMYPEKFPKPSCGPTETLPLYLIYQQADNAALQKRKDMVVKGCGCL